MAVGGVDEAIESGDAWGKKMFWRLHAALLVREERVLQGGCRGDVRGPVAGSFAISLARPSSARSVASSGAVTVVAR